MNEYKLSTKVTYILSFALYITGILCFIYNDSRFGIIFIILGFIICQQESNYLELSSRNIQKENK